MEVMILDEIVNQQKLKEDIDSLDIDEYLFEEKEKIDKQIQDYFIKLKALKLSKENQKYGR